MLTRLRFKNWRSLKDVTIDNLTPLTVFIGANSSGKTNILEGIQTLHRFVRDPDSDPQAVHFNYIQKDTARTIGSKPDDPLIFEVGASLSEDAPIKYRLELWQDDSRLHYRDTAFKDDDSVIASGQDGKGKYASRSIEFNDGGLMLDALGRFIEIEHTRPKPGVLGELYQFLSSRIQHLGEGFAPKFAVPMLSKESPYLFNPSGENLVTILDYMSNTNPNLYREFEDDLSWLLGHVSKLEIEHTDRETRLLIREKAFNEGIAPTVSLGTERAAAMLAAYYALDMRQANLPGLIAIEEPDTALNPDILDKFVELLRTYTTRADRPRQFILTTHNPAFLDYFEPDEVRIVERDAEGFTSVRPIDDDVRKTLLTKYTLGEVWKMRALGAIPDA